MASKDWAQYIDATNGLSKSWLLIQWQLQQLQVQRATLARETCPTKLHQALINLGQWWQGQLAAVFSTENLPGEMS